MIGGPLVMHLDEFAASWGLAPERDVDGVRIDAWGLARVLRREVNRRGAATTGEVFSVVIPVLEAIGAEPATAKKQVRGLLENMALIGEVEQFRGGPQTSWCRPISRCITINDTRGAVLGTSEELTSLAEAPIDRIVQFVRWVDLGDDSVASSLDQLGCRLCRLEDWAGLPGWCDSGFDRPLLAEQWHRHVTRLVETGQPISDDPKSIRVLRPDPGAYFGKAGVEPSGRWTLAADLPNGVQLGAMKGHSESHWLPLLVHCEEGRPTTGLMLNDWDQFYWLLLARGIAEGEPEIVRFRSEERQLRLSFPLPRFLLRVLQLCAIPDVDRAWSWRLPEGIEPTTWMLELNLCQVILGEN